MQSIHARLSHLESENAALSQAAEEAATLAESLASENAELRGQLRSADALQSEKDGEIQRLSASCAGHIKEIHRLKTDLTETNDSLKEERNSLKELMDMQTTLRQTVTKLQQQQSKRKQTSSSLLRLINLHGSITKVLSLDSLHIVLFNTAFIDLIVQSISDNNNHNDNQHIPPVIAKPLIDALINARDLARRAFSWTLSLHQQQSKSISTSKRYSATQFKNSLHDRARIIVQPVQALFDRVTASISDLQHPAFPVTNAAPVDVQAGLLQISIEAVDSIIADKESLDTINNNNNNNNNRTKRSSVSVPLVSIDDETMLNGMKNVLSPFYNHQDEKEEQKNFFRSSMPIEDQKEKEDWKKQKNEEIDSMKKRIVEVVKQKDRMVDDALVRCKAFEDALAIARSEVDVLRESLTSAHAQITTNKQQTSSNSNHSNPSSTTTNSIITSTLSTDENVDSTSTATNTTDRSTTPSSTVSNEKSQAQSALSEQSNLNEVNITDDENSSKQPCSTQVRDNLRRFRACYLRGAISDISSPLLPLSNEREKIQAKETYTAMSSALYRARLAAANAHVVKLDPESLKPVTCGATMSRRPILEALSVGKKMNAMLRNVHQPVKKCATEVTEFRFDVPKGGSTKDVLNVVKAHWT